MSNDIRRGWLHTDGDTKVQRVLIVGKTSTHYRIKADGEKVRLPTRTLRGEETALVHKRMVSERLTN